MILNRAICAAAAIGVMLTVVQTRAQDAGVPKGVSDLAALVVSATREQLGAAFCIHRAGLFVTTTHVAEGVDEIYVVQESVGGGNRKLRAEIFCQDAESGLVLLTTGQTNTPLQLGDETKLDDTTPVFAIGYEISRRGAVTEEYPTLDATSCSINAISHGRTTTTDVYLDVALGAGKAGGPLINGRGKVVGIVRSTDAGANLTSAIPVSSLKNLLRRPKLTFIPPKLQLSQIHRPIQFNVVMTTQFSSVTPRLELQLASSDGAQRRFPIPNSTGNRYQTEVIPVPSLIDVLIQSADGSITGQILDQKFMIGDRQKYLSSVGVLNFADRAAAVTQLTEKNGQIVGLENVAVRLGKTEVVVDLSKATEVRLSPQAPRSDALPLAYAIVATVEDEEVARLTGELEIEGPPPSDSGQRR